MGWLEIFLAFIAVSCLGFSWGAFLLFALCIGASFWLTHAFVRNGWDTDWYFEQVFKTFERFGCGTPHRLDRMSFTSYTAVDGYSRLDEIPKPLEDSIRRLIDNIVRDFILVWYNDVARGESFVEESRRVLEMLSVELYRRACQVDIYYLIEQTVLTYHAHLDRFNKSLRVVKAKDPKLRLKISPAQLLFQTYESQLRTKHPALTGQAQELSYLRNVVNSLLHALVPKDSFACNAGFFILREIVAVEVMQPLVSKLLTDPDWINEALTDLLTPNEISQDSVKISAPDSVDGKDQADGKQSTKDITNRDVKKIDSVQSAVAESYADLSRETKVTSVDAEDGKLGTETAVEDENVQGSSQEKMTPLTNVNLYRHSPDDGMCKEHSESFLVISMENSKQENEPKLKNMDSKAWSTEVIPPSSLEELSRSSSLSSSWHVCPSPKNDTFNTGSFEKMRKKLQSQEDNNSRNGKSDLGQNIKTLACCGYLQESVDVCPDSRGDEGNLSRLRSKSFSLPQLHDKDSEKVNHKRSHDKVKRSISVPCNLQSGTKLSEPDASIKNHDRSRTLSSLNSGPGFYGSPFCSFYSSSESFKSVSTDDESEDAEEAMEAYEDDGSDVRDTFSMLFQASAGNHVGYPRKRRSITKQAGFEESYGRQFQHPAAEVLSFPLCGPSEAQPSWSEGTGRSSKRSQETPVLEDIKEQSGELQVAKSNQDRPQKAWKNKESGSDPESFFAESILSAGRKFVSNLKPPFISNSTGSTKSSETSMASQSSLQSAPSSTSQDNAVVGGSETGHILGIEAGQTVRRFSRSDALVLQSSESDVETYYGSPEDTNPTREEIVYGCSGMTEADSVDGALERVIRIHPSKLITIPSTETANESVWEPGRSKYTLYLIEYDIRIWPEVYEAAIEESKAEDPKKNEIDDGKSPPAPEQDESQFRTVFVKRKIKRRYREFMELHHRLCTGIYKEEMKDVLKPNRKYSLHFTRLEPGVVEGRRTLLEYYVVSLVSKPVLRNSDELKQFLGVAGGELVSFVRPSVVQVPRVDKMLSRQVTKVFDSIKTAFDSVDESQLTQVHSKSRSTLQVDIEIPWKIEVFYPKRLGMEIPYLLSEECCDVFITEQEYWLSQTPTPPPEDTDLASEGTDSVDGFRKKLKATKLKLSHIGHEKFNLPLEPRTAGDGCEAPESPSFASDDMLYGDTTQGDIPCGIVPSGRAEILHKPLAACLNQPPGISESLENIPDVQEKPLTHQILGGKAKLGGLSKSESLDSISAGQREMDIIPAQVHPASDPSISMPSQSQAKSSQEGAKDGTTASSDDVVLQSDAQYSLTSAILNLTCEVLSGHNSWTSIDRVQETFIGSFGGLFEWKLLREVGDVTTDEGWAYALDKLNEAIWPNGKLREEDTSVKSEKEKAETKRKAVQALRDVFPGIFRVLVGSRVYDESAVSVVNSLQHPQINRILLFQLLELLLSQLLPELPVDHLQQAK